MNKEKEFVWTDELVKEFAYSYANNEFINLGIGVSKIESFKKLKEEEKTIVWTHDNDGVEINGISEGISFTLNDRLKVFYITKERLAEILIAESNGELFMDSVKDRKERNEKCISERQHFAELEKCWIASRNLKYTSFSLYMNDKQKPK